MARQSFLPRLTRSVAKRADSILTAVGLPGRLPVCATFERSYRKWVADDGDSTHRLNYSLTPDDVVFDVGGYRGDWAAEIVDRFGSQVHVFEPLESYCQQIEARFTDKDNVSVHRFGLAGHDGEFQLSVLEDESSQFKQSDQSVTCMLRSITEFMSDRAIDEVALLKLNIEGGEFELLEHLIDSDMIHLFQNIQVQFHWFAPDAHRRMDAIHQSLRKTHATSYQYPFVWENWAARAA